MAVHLWAAADAAGSRSRASGGSEPWGYAAGALTAVIAGSVLVAVKAVVGEMPPWTICCARSLISALVLLPLVAGHHAEMRAFLRDHWMQAAFIGSIGLGLTQGVLFTALHDTSAVSATIVFSLRPLLTMLLARFLLAEPLNAWQAVGAAIAFAGIVVISVQGSFARLLALDIRSGDLIALGAAVLFAGYTVLLKRARFELPRLPLLVILLAAGSSASFPFVLLEYWNGAHDNLTTKGIGALLYAGIVGGAVMYTLYNTSIEILGATRAGALLNGQLIFVAIFAWIFLGEPLEWFHYVGAGLVIAGVTMVTLLRPKPATAAS